MTIKQVSALILLAILIGLSATVFYYRGAYRSEHDNFVRFQQTTKDAGLEAQRQADAKEAAWNIKLNQLEDDYGKTIESDNARFARELQRVRTRAAGTAGGSVSEATATIGVCADAAGNQRLSAALSVYRAGILGELSACQIQTDTLIACQGILREVTQ